MNTYPRWFAILSVTILFAAITSLLAQPVRAQGEDPDRDSQTIMVNYYGRQTTFEELFEEGKEVHCITDRTPALVARGAFDPGIDQVLCFDSIAETNRVYATWEIDHPRSAELTLSSNRFHMYAHSGYSGWIFSVSADMPVNWQQVWSIWEEGTAAMRVYSQINYQGSSWLVSDSYWTLGWYWATNIHSIDFFS